MTDKDDILIGKFFSEAAQQQIADDGFTERVMRQLPDHQADIARKLSRLWTIFCIVVAAIIFFAFGGMEVLNGAWLSMQHMVMTAFEVLLLTAPTAEIPINPWVLVLLLAFVLIYLPYQTARKLSSVL